MTFLPLSSIFFNSLKQARNMEKTKVLLEIGDQVNIYGHRVNSNEIVLFLFGTYMGQGFIYINDKMETEYQDLYLHNIKDVQYWEYIVPISFLNPKQNPFFLHGLTWEHFKKENVGDADNASNCKLKDNEWFKKIQKIIAEKFG